MDLRRPEEVVEEEGGGEGGEDQIGRIPDDLLLHILGRVHDARSLARCLAVSRRFSSLVPLVPTVSLSFPSRLLRRASSGRWRPRSSGSYLSRLLDKFVRSPLRSLCRVVSPKLASCSGGGDGGDDCDCDNGSRPTPGEVLKPFKGIESLRVELPSCVDAVGLNGKRTVLRWTARFGGEMESCVVLGANSLRRRDAAAAADASSGEEGAPEPSPRAVGEVELEPAPVIAEEELKLRVVWIISCLIAASARHYLLKQIVADHPMLKSVSIVDSDKQGKVGMREEEIAEMRRSLDSAPAAADDDAAAAERIRVPDLRMKLWYAPELELPESGYVMRGATMVLIAPASKAGGEQGKAKEGGDLGDAAAKSASFEGGDGEEEAAFGEAVREMRKMKKTYVLEMNSF
ncbi:F-box protein At4g18380-like [Syzygium oleosum]|uniref:F-box protein At4g18380-like n=1 Tax=Syzygium oleosum TaxID=219896 RepID=UPI0011D285CF|nr:F-box protein At4g18380-like [Syzygium oleosum]